MGRLTDEQLAAELCPDNHAEGLAIVAGLSDNKRAVMVRMIEIADELNLHHAGLGPMPEGVIVTKARGKFRKERPEHKTVSRVRAIQTKESGHG